MAEFHRALASEVAEELGAVLDGLEEREQVGEVVFTGGAEFRFIPAERFRPGADDELAWDEQTVNDVALGDSGAAQAAVTAFDSWEEFATHIDGHLSRGGRLDRIGQTIDSGIMSGLKADLSRAMSPERARRVLLLAGMDDAVEQHEQAGRLGADERPDQTGLRGFTQEAGTRERRQRPGQEFVDEFRETGEPPREVAGWTYVPKDDRIGNRRFGDDTHAWITPDGHLRIRMRTPLPREDEWGVELADDRISGIGSAVDINSRKPGHERPYSSMESAIVAAIRWMARHPVDRAEHPFFDERIHDPPPTWELSSHRINQRDERIGFRLEDEDRAPPDLLKSIHIDGLHQGDRYTVRTGIRPDPGLEDFDSDARYPDPDQEVTRDRVLDAATRFMERNPFQERLPEGEESTDDTVADAGNGEGGAVCDALRDEVLRELNTDDLDRVDQETVFRTLNTAADRGCLSQNEAEGIENTLRGMEGARFPGSQLDQLSQRVIDAFGEKRDVDVHTFTGTEGEVLLELAPGDAIEVTFHNTIAGREDTVQGVIDRIRPGGDIVLEDGTVISGDDSAFAQRRADVIIGGRRRGHVRGADLPNAIRKLFD